jgi:hypothetical protein
MRKTDRSLKSMLSFGAAALLAVGAATAQVATSPSDAAFPGAAAIDSSGSFRSEVQACNSGMTQQDQATCLREARNAAADKSHGNLQPDRGHEQNALARCEVHPVGEDRAACEARVLGMGNIDGSVANGGLLRESETVVLPRGQHSVTIQPQTENPIVLVPSR